MKTRSEMARLICTSAVFGWALDPRRVRETLSGHLVREPIDANGDGQHACGSLGPLLCGSQAVAGLRQLDPEACNVVRLDAAARGELVGL